MRAAPNTEPFPSPTRDRPETAGRPHRRWRCLATGALALLLVGVLFAGISPSSGWAPAPGVPAGAPPSLHDPVPSGATHWLTPGWGPAAWPAPLASAVGQLPRPFARPDLNSSTFCDPFAPGEIWGNTGLNGTISTTPSSGTGPAPLQFGWSTQVFSGGLPPYATSVLVANSSGAVYQTFTSNLSGNVTLTTPGWYFVEVSVVDSTCSQSSYASTTLVAAGAEGGAPLQIVPTSLNGTAPFNESYHAVLNSSVPSNWTVVWYWPYPVPTASAFNNYTYVLPGTFWAEAALLDPSGHIYALVYSPMVRVGGSPPFTTAITFSPGPYPVNATLWVNRTAGSLGLLPANLTELYLYSLDFAGSSSSTNLTAELTVGGFGCGPGYTFPVDATGTCTIRFLVEVVGLNASMPDRGYFGQYGVNATLSAAGNASSWVLSATFSTGPLHAPAAPLNFSANLSAANAVPTYGYEYAVAGRASGPNGTFYPVFHGTVQNWNGSTVGLLFPLNATGFYFATFLIYDGNYGWDSYEPPLIVVGTNITVAAPLRVTSSESTNTSNASAPTTVRFSATSSGGVGPYTVQWAFGDGTFASSVLGATVEHVYGMPGTYQPSVTVRSSDGQSVTSTLPQVTVTGSGISPPGSGSGHPPVGSHRSHLFPVGGPAGGETLSFWVTAPLLGALLGSALLIVAGGLLYRRELRRQGEDLVAPWTEEEDAAPPPGEPEPVEG